MNKLLSGLMATTLGASFAIASVVPLNAAPVYVPKSEQAQTDVQRSITRDVTGESAAASC